RRRPSKPSSTRSPPRPTSTRTATSSSAPAAPTTPSPSSAATSPTTPSRGTCTTAWARRWRRPGRRPRPSRTTSTPGAWRRPSSTPGSTASWPSSAARTDGLPLRPRRLDDVLEDERGHDGGVALDDVAGGVRPELPPRDLLVGDGAGVGAVARRGVGDLAEVGPERRPPVHVLLQHGHDADGEVARDAAADLEEPDAGPLRVRRVPVGQPHHVLDAGLDGVGALHVAEEAVGGEDVAGGGVLPPRHDDGEVALGGGDEPGVLRVDLVVAFEGAGADHAVGELVGEVPAPLGLRRRPLAHQRLLEAAERLLLGDARVRDPVHAAVEEGLLVGRRE